MKDAVRTVLSAGQDDATTAFLFVSRGDPSIYAVTRDPQGANLPSDGAAITWECKGEFALGVREAMPVHIAPEPVLRGLDARPVGRHALLCLRHLQLDAFDLRAALLIDRKRLFKELLQVLALPSSSRIIWKRMGRR